MSKQEERVLLLASVSPGEGTANAVSGDNHAKNRDCDGNDGSSDSDDGDEEEEEEEEDAVITPDSIARRLAHQGGFGDDASSSEASSDGDTDPEDSESEPDMIGYSSSQDDKHGGGEEDTQAEPATGSSSALFQQLFHAASEDGDTDGSDDADRSVSRAEVIEDDCDDVIDLADQAGDVFSSEHRVHHRHKVSRRRRWTFAFSSTSSTGSEPHVELPHDDSVESLAHASSSRPPSLFIEELSTEIEDDDMFDATIYQRGPFSSEFPAQIHEADGDVPLRTPSSGSNVSDGGLSVHFPGIDHEGINTDGHQPRGPLRRHGASSVLSRSQSTGAMQKAFHDQPLEEFLHLLQPQHQRKTRRKQQQHQQHRAAPHQNSNVNEDDTVMHDAVRVGIRELCRIFNIPIERNTPTIGNLIAALGSIGAMTLSPQGQRLSLEGWKDRTDEHDYEDHEELSTGGFGTVWKAKHRHDKKYYAIKQIIIKKKKENEIKREVQVLADLRHKNIVTYLGSWVEDMNNQNVFSRFGRGLPEGINVGGSEFWSQTNASQTFDLDDCRCLFIRMELCEKTFADIIEENNRNYQKALAEGVPQAGVISFYERQRCLELFLQLIEGVIYIHEKNIMHRDIKPQNIFIVKDSNGHEAVKLGDFGLAQQASIITPVNMATECQGAATPEDSHTDNSGSSRTTTSIDTDGGASEPMGTREQKHVEGKRLLSKGVGTLSYAAPEQLQTDQYTVAADIYSLGIVLYEMFCPVGSLSERVEIIKKLRKGQEFWARSPAQNPFSQFLLHYPMEAHMCMSMLSHDPESRPLLRDIQFVLKYPSFFGSPLQFSSAFAQSAAFPHTYGKAAPGNPAQVHVDFPPFSSLPSNVEDVGNELIYGEAGTPQQRQGAEQEEAEQLAHTSRPRTMDERAKASPVVDGNSHHSSIHGGVVQSMQNALPDEVSPALSAGRRASFQSFSPLAPPIIGVNVGVVLTSDGNVPFLSRERSDGSDVSSIHGGIEASNHGPDLGMSSTPPPSLMQRDQRAFYGQGHADKGPAYATETSSSSHAISPEMPPQSQRPLMIPAPPMQTGSFAHVSSPHHMSTATHTGSPVLGMAAGMYPDQHAASVARSYSSSVYGAGELMMNEPFVQHRRRMHSESSSLYTRSRMSSESTDHGHPFPLQLAAVMTPPPPPAFENFGSQYPGPVSSCSISTQDPSASTGQNLQPTVKKSEFDDSSRGPEEGGVEALVADISKLELSEEGSDSVGELEEGKNGAEESSYGEENPAVHSANIMTGNVAAEEDGGSHVSTTPDASGVLQDSTGCRSSRDDREDSACTSGRPKESDRKKGMVSSESNHAENQRSLQSNAAMTAGPKSSDSATNTSPGLVSGQRMPGEPSHAQGLSNEDAGHHMKCSKPDGHSPAAVQQNRSEASPRRDLDYRHHHHIERAVATKNTQQQSKLGAKTTVQAPPIPYKELYAMCFEQKRLLLMLRRQVTSLDSRCATLESERETLLQELYHIKTEILGIEPDDAM